MIFKKELITTYHADLLSKHNHILTYCQPADK